MNAVFERDFIGNNSGRYALSSAHSTSTSAFFISTDVNNINNRRNIYNPLSLSINKTMELEGYRIRMISGHTGYSFSNSRIDSIVSRVKNDAQWEARIIELSTKINILSSSSDGSSGFFERNYIKYEVSTTLKNVQCMEGLNEREASRYLMRDLETRLKSRELNYIDEMLNTLVDKNLTPRCVVSVLRTTYRAKKFLSKWDITLALVEKYLSEKGLNSHAWLIGLINGKK